MNSWNDLFAQAPPSMRSETLRLAILGIGHELYGDDGVGLHAARRLQAACGQLPDVLVIEAGPSPENFTGPLRRFKPDLVVMIDAVDMGEPPGSLRWIEWPDVDGLSAATHRMPPGTLATFLMRELGCQVALLGIQVGEIAFDRPLTPEVSAALKAILVNPIQFMEQNYPK
ncbi:MAG TPA: hydrogenase 3 maturation endopeptidase HyCI [Levilinea sp.]|nr:hydrogenase 3 maturation endopeptidase HyCI [Levilinea sp.]